MQVSIDMIDLIRILLKKIWLILLVSVIGLLSAFGYTKIFISPQYTASIKLYVSNTKMEDDQVKINYSDLNAAQQLVRTYAVIVQSNQVINSVLDSVDLPYSMGQIRSMIKVDSVDETEVMQLSVTCGNPQQAADIANAFADVAPDQIKNITKAGYVELVDKAVPVFHPTSPNTPRNSILGFLFGFIVSAFIVILREMLDVHIKNEDDLKKHYKTPMLGSIPSIHSDNKGGYQRNE